MSAIFIHRKSPVLVVRAGFSLVEVNLAILLISVGLLTLFALFPLGLRENEAAIVDTQEAMFAEYMLSGIRANAQSIMNWDHWIETDPDVHTNFYDRLAADIDILKKHGWKETGKAVSFPADEDEVDDKVVKRALRYRLTIDLDDPDDDGQHANDGNYRKRVVVRVASGKYGDFEALNPRIYATDIVFGGM